MSLLRHIQGFASIRTKGAMVCFPCAMATPGRQKEAEQNFGEQLGAAGPVPAIGTEAGSFPVEHLGIDMRRARKPRASQKLGNN